MKKNVYWFCFILQLSVNKITANKTVFLCQKLEQDVKDLENDKSHLESAMKGVNDILRDERKKMEDIFDNMKEELKSNMQMNEVCLECNTIRRNIVKLSLSTFCGFHSPSFRSSSNLPQIGEVWWQCASSFQLSVRSDVQRIPKQPLTKHWLAPWCVVLRDTWEGREKKQSYVKHGL